jgi:5-methylcytosine-specific restriction endonuclease McrA
MKKCGTCKITKTKEEFSKDNTKADTLNYRCKSCNKKATKRYYDKNPKYYCKRSKIWREKNPGKFNFYVAAWRKKNPDKHKIIRNEASRRSVIKRRTFKNNNGKIDYGITMQKLYTRDNRVCGICKKVVIPDNWSLDHIRPISKGGTHTWDNIQLAHWICNVKKRDNYAAIDVH